jgi:hypothetical protein
MDKSKTTSNHKSESNNSSKELKNPVKYEQSVYLTHRCNEAVEYKFMGKYHRFEAYERKKFSRKILKDKNFVKAKKYFNEEKGKE